MGVDEFGRYMELIGLPGTDETTLARPTWDAARWEASQRRFHALVDVWFHEPLAAAGFRGQAPRWWYGRGPVRPVLDLQRSPSAQLEGLIDFTANWGIWVEGFARRVSDAKRPTPRTTQAPFASRIGQRLGAGVDDVWWAVTPERVVRHLPLAEEPHPPTAHDEVPTVLRTTLIPMLVPVDTLAKAIDAIEAWTAGRFHPSVSWIRDPLIDLHDLAREEGR